MTEEQTFKVHVHLEDGVLWAESPDFPGLFVSGEDPGEIREALEEALGLYLSTAERSVRVRVVEMDPIKDGFESARVLVDA